MNGKPFLIALFIIGDKVQLGISILQSRPGESTLRKDQRVKAKIKAANAILIAALGI
jgi:hypothetical protein